MGANLPVAERPEGSAKFPNLVHDATQVGKFRASFGSRAARAYK
jgi:hypothetical protein